MALPEIDKSRTTIDGDVLTVTLIIDGREITKRFSTSMSNEDIMKAIQAEAETYTAEKDRLSSFLADADKSIIVSTK